MDQQWQPAPGMDLVTMESLAMALWLKEVSHKLWRGSRKNAAPGLGGKAVCLWA